MGDNLIWHVGLHKVKILCYRWYDERAGPFLMWIDIHLSSNVGVFQTVGLTTLWKGVCELEQRARTAGVRTLGVSLRYVVRHRSRMR